MSRCFASTSLPRFVVQFAGLLGASILVTLFAVRSSAESGRGAWIVDRHVEAMGGVEAWSELRSLRLVGTTASSRLEVVWKRPDAIFVEETDLESGLTMTRAMRGDEAWIVSPFPPNPGLRPMSAEQRRRLAAERPLGGALVAARLEGWPVVYEGEETVAGGLAHRLAVTLPDGGEVRVLVDARSYRTLLTRRVRRLRTGQKKTVEVAFGDYRQVSGLWVPGSWGAMRLEAEVNPEIPASKFAPPTDG